jgi:hypothetical protein
VNRLGELNRQVADDPLVAIFRELNHTVAGRHAGAHQAERRAANFAGQLVPGDGPIRAVVLDVDRVALAVRGDSFGEERDQRRVVLHIRHRTTLAPL